MFGREYAQHVDLLMHSYGEMNKDYLRKANEKNRAAFIETFKKLYVFLFGIPEIGFQVRSIYFDKILGAYIHDKKLTNILDAGSGIGAYAFWLGRTFPRAFVIGGDIDRHKLKSCQMLIKELHAKNVSFNYLDVTKTNGKETYDLIVTIDVLEHVGDFMKVLHNFHRLLRKNGLLYIHVPQPHQRRIFRSLREWHHEDHVREGISKKVLEETLKKIGYEVIVSRETFGFFGKLAWELNHIMLSRSFLLAGVTFPFLYLLAIIDQLQRNKNGLGVAILATKI